MPVTPDLTLPSFVAELDQAVSSSISSETICAAVKAVLQRYCQPGHAPFLPERALRTSSAGYARHLLHDDPAGRYSAVAMVWDVGQGTPIHDHANMWCVEVVYSGRIEVVSYDRVCSGDGDVVEFEPARRVFAGRGEAGSLIPPFDYHTIACAGDEPAVTIHIYGGVMEWCHTYEALGEGRYRRSRKPLAFTS